MVCTRKTKTLVSTCVILSGMTNIVCLLYVGWVTNYIASVYVKVQEPISEKKLEEDKGDTLRIIERLDHLENVIKQHIQGTTLPPRLLSLPTPPLAVCSLHPLPSRLLSVRVTFLSRSGRAIPQPGRAGGCAEAAVRVGVPGGPLPAPAERSGGGGLRAARGGPAPLPSLRTGRRLRGAGRGRRGLGAGRRRAPGRRGLRTRALGSGGSPAGLGSAWCCNKPDLSSVPVCVLLK